MWGFQSMLISTGDGQYSTRFPGVPNDTLEGRRKASPRSVG